MAAKMKKVSAKKSSAGKPANSGASRSSAGKGTTLAAISYLWVAGLIILLTEKKDSFVRFHAKQATALFLVETLATMSIVLAWLTPIAGIAGLVGIIMAIQGKETKIPVAYELGEWFAGLIGQK